MQRVITAIQKIQEVSALLENPGSRISAGGTAFPEDGTGDLHLIDISGLENLDGIKQKGNRIEIGPLAALSKLVSSPILQKYAPALAEAAASVENETIRERGTLGGNLADPRIGDTAAALLAGGAKLTIRTGNDFRELLIDRFWRQDGENDLQYDEWITRITITIPKEPCWGAAFGKRGEWDSDLAAAVLLSINGKKIVTGVRAGLRSGPGSIRRLFAFEKALKNKPATKENITHAARQAFPAAKVTLNEADFSAFLTETAERALSMAEAMAEERRLI